MSVGPQPVEVEAAHAVQAVQPRHGARQLRRDVGRGGPVRHQHQHARLGEPLDEVRQQLQRRRSRPVQVLEREDDRAAPAQPAQCLDDARRRPAAGARGRARPGRRSARPPPAGPRPRRRPRSDRRAAPRRAARRAGTAGRGRPRSSRRAPRRPGRPVRRTARRAAGTCRPRAPRRARPPDGSRAAPPTRRPRGPRAPRTGRRAPAASRRSSATADGGRAAAATSATLDLRARAVEAPPDGQI